MKIGTPIGGWLILVGLGVIATPLRLIVDSIREPLLVNGDGWMAAFATDQYAVFSYLFVIHIYHVFKLLFSVLLVVLFFERRSSFPRLMIIQLISSFFIIVSDEFAAAAIAADGTRASVPEIGRALISRIIWVPYLMISERVRETFVIRRDVGQNDDEENTIEKNRNIHLEETSQSV